MWGFRDNLFGNCDMLALLIQVNYIFVLSGLNYGFVFSALNYIVPFMTAMRRITLDTSYYSYLFLRLSNVRHLKSYTWTDFADPILLIRY